jgi:hypothetical protein
VKFQTVFAQPVQTGRDKSAVTAQIGHIKYSSEDGYVHFPSQLAVESLLISWQERDLQLLHQQLKMKGW